MLGVSLRVAKNLCASVQPDETFGSMSDKWTTKKCAWALNRESWTSSKGKKGIWQLGCSKDSGNKGSRVDNDKDCVDPCENINPISLPDDKPNENLYETCEYGAFKSSLYCRNYQFCNHSSTEKSDAHLWTEIVCPKHLYWHPEEQRCANFSVLPIKTKEEYCAQNCIPVCSKGTPKHIRKGQKDTPPFEDGQQQCRNNSWDWCRLMERRNNTDYCRNYQECQINETGDGTLHGKLRTLG
ncbi:unnamed protein product [Allacma fusca]|uniref:Chitin-binding type-2 domain-containing protein n=1 Tax=Allacma fusca TaxID=39272 RepID=A0A8J2Q286_9HEXA|nr:unnamed protein product [Allacma fusca]